MREVGTQDFIGIKVGTDHEHTAIELMNWIFTSSDMVPGSQHLAFTTEEDPHNDMENARGLDLIRTEDNVVDYFIATVKTTNTTMKRNLTV